MTRLASSGGPVGAHLLHTLVELAFMGINVATAAIEIAPVIDSSRLRLKLRRFPMALGAGHSNVSARQDEAGLLVLGQGEGGGFVAFESVAALASVEVWSCGELAGMPVCMAIGAALEFHLEQGVLALRYVALGALQSRVSTLQRISARGVFLHSERRRAPAVYVMA